VERPAGRATSVVSAFYVKVGLRRKVDFLVDFLPRKTLDWLDFFKLSAKR
jgi:hypothetical protein